MARKAMTSEQYAAKKGCICPVCRGKDVQAGNMDADGDEVWSEVECLDCGATWKDVFKLVGYTDLEKGDKK